MRQEYVGSSEDEGMGRERRVDIRLSRQRTFAIVMRIRVEEWGGEVRSDSSYRKGADD